MSARTRHVILRYGESLRHDAQAFFEDDATLYENLASAIPKAQQLGQFPSSVSVESIQIFHDDKRLDLHVTLDEQISGNANRPILIIKDHASSIQMRIRGLFDDVGYRTHVQFVNPNEVLGEQLSTYFQEIKALTMRRRRPKSRALYAQVGDKLRRLDLRKPLIVQGFETGFKAQLGRPLYGWPPGKMAIALCAVIGIAVIGVGGYAVFTRLFSSALSVYEVRIRSDVDAHVRIADGQLGTIHERQVGPDAAEPVQLGAVAHRIQVLPKDYPIFEFLYVPESQDADGVDLELGVADRFANINPIELTVAAWEGTPSSKTRRLAGLSINGFERPLDDFRTFRGALPTGLYEIRFSAFAEEDLNTVTMKPDGIWQKESFLFDLSDVAGGKADLTFYYDPAN